MSLISVDILQALDWLCAWQLEQTAEQVDKLAAKEQTSFDIRSNTQVFYAAALSKIYAEVCLASPPFIHRVRTLKRVLELQSKL